MFPVVGVVGTVGFGVTRAFVFGVVVAGIAVVPVFVELAVSKGIVVEAGGVGTTARVVFEEEKFIAEPRYTAAAPIRFTTIGTKRVE